MLLYREVIYVLLQQEIQDALKEVCLVLPSEFKHACNNLIAQEGQILINDLVNGMDPGVVCSRIKACPGKSDIIKVIWYFIVSQSSDAFE